MKYLFSTGSNDRFHALLILCGAVLLTARLGLSAGQACHGTVLDAQGNGIAGVVVELRSGSGQSFHAATDQRGAFVVAAPPGSYQITVGWQQRTASFDRPVSVPASGNATLRLTVYADGHLTLAPPDAAPGPSPAEPGSVEEPAKAQGSGGEKLSSKQVSSLPLNKRDFSQLLLLAGGTQSDTNGSSNFTQQFAVNGQRGTTAVFAMDGIFLSDPEMSGATFSDFNVEAIEEIRSSSGVMPAEVGEGAASFTDIITKRGTSQLHGDAFSFVRNAAFDARNFFDQRTFAQPGRIPPFARNEFGFTLGGPVVLPGLSHGRDKTFFFGQYQGFRQVLGTTQMFPVPTAAERQGRDTTAYPGDTLTVPVSPEIAKVLARYPTPNDPQGSFGARTYAASSKVSTDNDQFSVRIDHRTSAQAAIFARFNLNNVSGPLTNPDQTAIDPSFAIRFYDHQRNFGLAYTRTLSPRLTSESSFGFIRTTPLYPTENRTQPGLGFTDGLFESFNTAAGSVMGAFTNLFQLRQNFSYVRGKHALKWGGEARFNRDTPIFGMEINGLYSFGGGPAYAASAIPSASGGHNVHAGDLLPDTLTSLLSGSAHAYMISEAPPMFSQGDMMGEVAVRRQAYNAYLQDTWKVTPRLTVSYGLRYEVTTPLHEAYHLTAGVLFTGPNGRQVGAWDAGAQPEYVVNPQPAYVFDRHGWGPRLAVEWRVADRTVLHAGAALTTVLVNPWMDNMLMGAAPFVMSPLALAKEGAPVEYQNSVAHTTLPEVYTPAGRQIYALGQNSATVAPNTEVDVERFENDLAAAAGTSQIQPYTILGMAQNFRNGYIETYTAGLEHDFGAVKFSASYVGTAGVKLASLQNFNGYNGAEAAFAPFTRFNSAGQMVGGVGEVQLMTTRSHSTFHSLQTGVSKTSRRAGLGFTANYTYSKSLDDISSPLPGMFSSYSSGVLQASAQDPRNPGADKGPSVFDITHAFSVSLIQELPFDRIAYFRTLGRLASGWQILNISTLASGLPFTVYSGVQQTGVGVNSADRPDQVGTPVLSTNRKIREDYFGLGDHNTSFFSIPIGVQGGTGPNQGRFGTLGRDTFRGPGYRNFDLALIKDTEVAQRSGREAIRLQFRAEVFNAFNLVNFGLPFNILRGSGFGTISRTAGNSRQIQLSMKLTF